MTVEAVWAGPTIIVTREGNRPQPSVIRAGQEVSWINGSGGIAHVWFAGTDAPRFYVGREEPLKFTEPGTYDYAVHVSGTKAHAHTGTVIVK